MRRTMRYVFCFVVTMLGLSLFALPGPTDHSFLKGAMFTVAGYTNENGTARSEPLSGFPVLVRISEDSPSGFSYADLASSTGDDLCFIDMDGTGLPFEIDTWDTNSTSLIWVRLPTMQNGTEFVMCWGGGTSGKNVCGDSPFSNYVGVWHMSESSGTVADSSGHSLTATPSGSGSSTMSVAVSGPVGNGRQLSTNITVCSYLSVPSYDSSNVDNTFAVSGWFNVSTNQTVDGRVFSRKENWEHQNGWEVVWKSSKAFSTRGAHKDANAQYNTAFGEGWKHFFIVYNGSTSTIFENGVQMANKTGGHAATDNNKCLSIGSYSGGAQQSTLVGSVDECRLLDTVPGADWAWAEYASMADAAFLSAGEAQSYGGTFPPAVSIAVTDRQYTNASFTVSVGSIGTGGVQADVSAMFAATDDFASPLWTTNYTVHGVDAQSVSLAGLATGTTYYMQAQIVNDQNVTNKSPVVTLATLAPGAPTGTAAFVSGGFSRMTASATTTTFGVGAASATMRLEASTAADFETVVAGAEADAIVNAMSELSVSGLAPGSTYHLRVRLRNDWGLETFLTLPDAVTPSVPLESTGIGYIWSPDGSTIDFTFGVSAVYDSATCTAELFYGGTPYGRRDFSGPGSLSWPGVAAASDARPVTVTVTAVVDGATYTHTWAVTVSPGSYAYAVSSLAEVSSLALHVGDTLTLPALARADDRYVAMDIRSFSLGEDGRTLKALEPGFSAVVSITRDVENDSYAIVGRALAVCIPEVAGSGRVFFAKPGAKMNWEDTSKWTNVTDPSAEADYPHLAGDVAMAALPDDQLILNADATVAELYLGPDEEHLHSGGTQRLTGKNSATLKFARPSGKPGLLRFTGMLRIDTPAITNGFNRFAIGGGDGNSTSTGLGIEMPGGLEFDCGAWPDYTDTAIRNTFARARYWVSDSMRFWNIPAGKTLRISNTNGRKMEGDSQDGNANFNWSSGSQVTGEGTFFYDAASSILTKGMFRTFRGIVKVSNKQAYDTFGPGDRGGGFKFRPEGYSSSSAQVAENATLLLEGDSSGSAGSSFGVVNAGHTHGFGSWGRAINAYPAKRWVLDGGYVYQTYVGSTDVSWREDGTTNSPPVCIPNGAGTLCVSNGFNYVKLSQNSDEKIPTNSLVFAALEHAGDGVLLVRSDRLFNSFQNSGWRDRIVLGGFHDLAIGGTGRAVARHGGESVRTNYLESTAPIVPWIVAPVQADNSLYFPGADDDTDELVLAGATKSTVLDEVLDPTENIRVDGTTIAISADRTVNSLVLVNNRTAGKNLGAGRTLTITSGGLIIGNGNYNNTAYIGDENGYNAGTAGTIAFPGKAYVFDAVVKDDKNYHPEIWAKIVAPGGAVFSGLGDLHLGGDQTGIDDHIAVNGTDIRLGTETTGCQIDVPVHIHGAFARLRIEKQGSFCKQDLYFWDHGTTGSKFEAAAGTEEPVHKLFVDGVSMPRGTYGATGSGAQFIDDNHFVGTGVARVIKDDVTNPLILRIR